MASTREIRRRIRSVANMSQITRAMEMVSAAKMRKAQTRVTASRPYSEQLRQIMSDLATQQPDPEQLQQFPLLQKRPVQERRADRRHAGPRADRRAEHQHPAPRHPLHPGGGRRRRCAVIAVGKKARDYFVRTRQDVIAEFIGIGDNHRRSTPSGRSPTSPSTTSPRARSTRSTSSTRDFVNTLVQRPEVMQILPVEPPPAHAGYADYIFEPSPEAVLNDLLPRYVEVEIYQAILEGLASEHSARMVAMRNASDNAKEIAAGSDALAEQGPSGPDHARGLRDRRRRQRAGRLGHE